MGRKLGTQRPSGIFGSEKLSPLTGITVSDFEADDTIYQMGRAPVRVDIFTGVEGVDFSACWERRVTTSFEGVTAFILSKDDLIAAKIASARPQDLLDVATLQES